MKKFILLAICLVAATLVNAQAPSLQWVKQIGGPLDDGGRSVVVDAAGNVYTTGFFNGTVDFDPGPGTYNLTSTSGSDEIFISKLDASGHFIWAEMIMEGFNINYPSIAVDAAANIYMTGQFLGSVDFDPGVGTFYLTSDSAITNMFILKLDVSGNFVWAKKVGGAYIDGEYDSGSAITLDAADNVYTAGSFQGTVDFDPGPGTFNLTSGGDGSRSDIFISKSDASGNFVWVKQIGGTQDNTASAIAVDASGNVYTTGSFNGIADFNPGAGIHNLINADSFSFEGDAFISKLDASGNFVWAKKVTGIFSHGFSIALDASDNVCITGAFVGTCDFDPDTATFNLTSAGFEDTFVLKLDVSGNFVWVKRIGGSGRDNGIGIATDAANNIYEGGFFSGTCDFDPGTATFNLTVDSVGSVGSLDLFILKLDPSGNFVWALKPGGCWIDGFYAKFFAVDGSNNVYSTGLFNSTRDFDPGAGIFNLTDTDSSNRTNDIFIQKLRAANIATGINEYSHESNISIYPNPSNGIFNVVVSAPVKNVSIEIYNSIGALVYIKQTQDMQTTIELTSQADGLYIIKVMNEGKIIGSQKILKE